MKLLRAVLMVPVAAAAGVVAVGLAKAWNDYVGVGGALAVGMGAAALVLWLDRREPPD